jgi:hypothetical protein
MKLQKTIDRKVVRAALNKQVKAVPKEMELGERCVCVGVLVCWCVGL